ncbi:terpene synthase 10-like isoform X2 [Vicia villosa]|uniref:terpene synthase 10-like isoform X2 n=1 Tax=Vicia villosa TaxID=3911 RepID=UPI00273BC533|nr:terpene synthase 10-like isoform X2 [Vicia villosa]
MAFSTLAPYPISFTNIFLPLKKRSSSLAIWNSNFHRTTQCKATYEVANDHSQTVPRRTFKFQPSIWTYDYIQSLSSEYTKVTYKEQNLMLREKVRMMFKKMESEIDQLEFIDVLQRLGVDYHFKNEIRNMLDNIHNTQTSNLKNNLYGTSLKFRLLRQHGYNISPDVFACFQDKTRNFEKCHSLDIEGMLALYESSFHSFEEETILDEARNFTTKYLKECDLNGNRDTYILHLINHALEVPLHWRIHRWESQWFIDVYERKKNMNPVLLQFAKMDFNIVQSIYQEELKQASRWWKKTGLGEKLNFARDRLVENFVWTVGTNFNPNLEYSRKIITKVNALITIIDDVYDVYGTLEELELFTKAINRWDLNGLDSLPTYMKICFEALYNFVDEFDFEIQNKSGYHVTPHLKKVWTSLCKAYLIEAKWYHGGYTPSLEEYLENAWISISVPVILTHTYFLIQDSFKKEELVCLQEISNIIRFSAMISRLANDLGTYKRENETGDIPKSIQCYMNETGASESEAREYLKSMIFTLWKNMNKETHTSFFSEGFKDTIINLTRMSLCMYQHGDGHTIQDYEIQNHVMLLIFKPIPIVSTRQ